MAPKTWAVLDFKRCALSNKARDSLNRLHNIVEMREKKKRFRKQNLSFWKALARLNTMGSRVSDAT